jgi:hypothetical protein
MREYLLSVKRSYIFNAIVVTTYLCTIIAVGLRYLHNERWTIIILVERNNFYNYINVNLIYYNIINNNETYFYRTDEIYTVMNCLQ